MSSPLPKALRQQIKDAARNPDTGLLECAGCRGEFGDDEVQVDHIVPEHIAVDHSPSNLQILCYPKDKAAPSCHKAKSAREAAARATARIRGRRSPSDLPVTIASGIAATVAARCAWLMWHERDPLPFLAQVQHGLSVAVIGTALIVLAYALAHIGHGEAAPPKVAKVRTGETPEQRLTAALREEMGQAGQIRVRRVTWLGLPAYQASYGQTGFDDHEDAKRYSVNKRVNAKMGGRWLLTWDTEADRVVLQPRPELPALVPHPGADPDLPWFQIPISPSVTIDLKKTPHVLVTGETAAGKTSIFRSAIISLGHHARAGTIRLLLLDPKMVELIGFVGWPGVMNVMTEDQELWDAPGEVEAEMRRRMRLFKDEGVPLSEHQPWVVIVDEYREMVKRLDAWSLKPDVGLRKTRSAPLEPVENVATLLAMARRMNIHLILGTQRPDAKWFGGDARDNCPFRIGVGGLSPTLSRMLFNDSSVGRDIPAEAKGRFTAQQDNGQFVEDIAYWVPDPTDADGTNTEADWELLRRLGMPERTTV